MTFDDILDAKRALEEAGIPVSANTLLARMQRGSKRDVVALLRQVRAAEQGPATREEAPAPALVPPEAGPPPAPEGERLQRATGPVPDRGAVTTCSELAYLRRQYHATAAAARGTAVGSPEQQALEALRHAFSERCLVMRTWVKQARQLAPRVSYERACAATVATGVADAEGYAVRLAQGTMPQAQMLARAMQELAMFLGAQEAARLVTTTEEPRWFLYP